MTIMTPHGPERDPSAAMLSVPPEHMREMSNELHAMADEVESDVVAQMRSTRIEPAGLDAVSVAVAEDLHEQIHSPNGGGLVCAKLASDSLRAGALLMAQGAAAYEAQEEATAASFRAGPAT